MKLKFWTSFSQNAKVHKWPTLRVLNVKILYQFSKLYWCRNRTLGIKKFAIEVPVFKIYTFSIIWMAGPVWTMFVWDKTLKMGLVDVSKYWILLLVMIIIDLKIVGSIISKPDQMLCFQHLETTIKYFFKYFFSKSNYLRQTLNSAALTHRQNRLQPRAPNFLGDLIVF